MKVSELVNGNLVPQFVGFQSPSVHSLIPSSMHGSLQCSYLRSSILRLIPSF